MKERAARIALAKKAAEQAGKEGIHLPPVEQIFDFRDLTPAEIAKGKELEALAKNCLLKNAKTFA